jgi:hydrogenase maturation protease
VILVIGYGNELRRDDGAGPAVARTVIEWHSPRFRGLAVQQLTPELVEAVAGAAEVLFVDASFEGFAPFPSVTFHLLQSDPEPAPLIHALTPARLLGLTHALFGSIPPARLLTIPAQDFGFGEGLSPLAQSGVEEALRWLVGLR